MIDAPVSPDFNREREAAIDLVLAAGAALRAYRAGEVKVRHKQGHELVTDGDLQADAIIRAGLTAAFPTDAVFSEESPQGVERLEFDRVWIVDPLDSTSNFVENGDEYCVSVGLAVCGSPVVGAVYNPTRDQLIAGSTGSGVWLNGVPSHVSNRQTLHGARITVSRKEWRRGLRCLPDGHSLQPVASMAYKLARVAAGLDDGTVSLKARKEWGTCAGVALVFAAGGMVTVGDGQSIRFNRSPGEQPAGLVASGPLLHPLLVAAMILARSSNG